MLRLFSHALTELRAQGAEVIDSVTVDGFEAMMKADTGNCNTFRRDINQYLSGLGDQVPVHTLGEIIKSGKYHPSIEARLTESQAFDRPPEETRACRTEEDTRARLRIAVLHLMDSRQLDALAYPTWSNPPRLIGDLNTPAGDNNQIFSPATGFPAITVPMGFLRNGRLPAGLQLLGRPWSEGELIRLAYAYEQATHHRHPPPADTAQETSGR
jgi:amidase